MWQWINELLGKKDDHADDVRSILEERARRRGLERIREARELVRRARAILEAPTSTMPTATLAVGLFAAMHPVRQACEAGVDPTPERVTALRKALDRIGGQATVLGGMVVSHEPEELLRQADTMYDRCNRENLIEHMGALDDAKRALHQAIALHAGKQPAHFVEDLRTAISAAIESLVSLQRRRRDRPRGVAR